MGDAAHTSAVAPQCQRCGYLLIGLDGARVCPECGWEIDWGLVFRRPRPRAVRWGLGALLLLTLCALSLHSMTGATLQFTRDLIAWDILPHMSVDHRLSGPLYVLWACTVAATFVLMAGLLSNSERVARVCVFLCLPALAVCVGSSLVDLALGYRGAEGGLILCTPALVTFPLVRWELGKRLQDWNNGKGTEAVASGWAQSRQAGFRTASRVLFALLVPLVVVLPFQAAGFPPGRTSLDFTQANEALPRPYWSVYSWATLSYAGAYAGTLFLLVGVQVRSARAARAVATVSLVTMVLVLHGTFVRNMVLPCGVYWEDLMLTTYAVVAYAVVLRGAGGGRCHRGARGAERGQ